MKETFSPIFLINCLIISKCTIIAIECSIQEKLQFALRWLFLLKAMHLKFGPNEWLGFPNKMSGNSD